MTAEEESRSAETPSAVGSETESIERYPGNSTLWHHVSSLRTRIHSVNYVAGTVDGDTEESVVVSSSLASHGIPHYALKAAKPAV